MQNLALKPQILVLFDKLTVPRLVKKFVAFYPTWKLIVFQKKAQNLSLSQARRIQSTVSHKIHFNII